VEPQNLSSLPEALTTGQDQNLEAPEAVDQAVVTVPQLAPPHASDSGGLARIFVGSHGLRAGWSALLFYLLYTLSSRGIGLLLETLHIRTDVVKDFSPQVLIPRELARVLGLLIAAALMALIERRRLLDYNLRAPRPLLHFAGGIASGFLVVSALLGLLALGGYVTFGPIALSGADILRFAALWGVAFLLVACYEEGFFRCYLQYTLTRGINFWWALTAVGLLCLDLILTHKGNGAWGVYVTALGGVAPCLLLHVRKTRGGGFWQAAWVTSTYFAFLHTANGGENWFGIFSVALIGFALCASVRLTGSAWWALGLHAGWDWTETFFYGSTDSGYVAHGHLLTTSPAGAVLWSGGTDGPEGSVLVLPVVLVLLLLLYLVYGREKTERVPGVQELAG
jgi:uncharacterized protein